MFEGLDQIDWENLGYHIYRGKEKIPDAIRNLLSQDPDIRDEARADLLGWGQEYGDITDTTPYIIPFILEVLNSPHAPGFEPRIRLLKAIVENQKFWEIPTNMFSFFAGLPDSPEELRAILNSSADS